MKTALKLRLVNFPGFESLCRALTRRHVRAFMYHRFRAGNEAPHRGIDPATLRAQIELISRHHAVITPEGHLGAIRGEDQGSCPVVVTADDGYADFYEVAYPLFREAGIPAMLFVTTGFVAGQTWFWWDKLAYLLERGPDRNFRFQTGQESFDLDLTTARGRKRAWNMIADRCRFLEDKPKNRLITDLASLLGEELPASGPADRAAVTWDQVRTMSRHGILIGAHTINHPILTRVDQETAEQEIEGSRKTLVEELGQPVEWFCYPQGGPADFNDRVKDQVAGSFKGCYLSYQDLNAGQDPFVLPRYGVSEDLLEFRWTLCGAELIVLKLKKFFGLKTGITDFYWVGSKGSSHGHR